MIDQRGRFASLSRSQTRGRALVMALQYLGLFGHLQDSVSLAVEWEVSKARARKIVQLGLGCSYSKGTRAGSVTYHLTLGWYAVSAS